MTLRTHRLVTLLLASLAMGMKLAHALEFAPKLQWSAPLYLAVQSTLYRVFGVVGPVFELGAYVGVLALARRTRGRPSYPSAVVSAVAITLSLVAFVALVLPANAHIRQWISSGSIGSDWTRWRVQWQLAQTLGFALHFVSLAALLRAILRETPDA